MFENSATGYSGASFSIPVEFSLDLKLLREKKIDAVESDRLYLENRRSDITGFQRKKRIGRRFSCKQGPGLA